MEDEQQLMEFREEYLQSIKLQSAVDLDFYRSEFVQSVINSLIETDEIQDFTPCYYEGVVGAKGKKVEIDGYNFDEDDGTFTIVACLFSGKSNELPTATKTEINKLSERASRFVQCALDHIIQDSIEESETAFELANYIDSIREQIQRFKIYIVSDMVKSERIKSLTVDEIDSKDTVMYLWDISNLYDLQVSKKGYDDIEISLKDFGIAGLPCLKACEHGKSSKYDSYLCVMPGTLLSALFEKYGGRLLESNVRSFLKLSTNTNKAIRATILKQPEMFFAYNNGITATATDLTIEDKSGNGVITGFTSLQIVNGGQTTVTIYSVGLSKDKPDLSKVFVPMKISVILPADAEEIVPIISRSANTQNKVSEADFFSNHPFHIQMHNLSRQIRAPQVAGAPFATRWYYERTRGEYQQDQLSMTVAERNKFKLENPKNQLITKTDLAKYRNSFDQKPDVVSKGAQFSFLSFASTISDAWGTEGAAFNETYFRDSVALAILFHATEDIISKQAWYNGGYRAQIVTYSIAKLASMIQTMGGALDLEKIWVNQAIPELLRQQLVVITAAVNECITTQKEEDNVSQWCKKHQCWGKVKELPIVPDLGLKTCLISEKKERWVKRTAARDQRQTSSMQSLIDVVNAGSDYWIKLYEWANENDMLDSVEKSILRTACSIETKRPSEKQAVAIIHIREKVRESGYTK